MWIKICINQELLTDSNIVLSCTKESCLNAEYNESYRVLIQMITRTQKSHYIAL